MSTFASNAESMQAEWIASSVSTGGHNCVQIAALATGDIGVRDSKDPSGPALLLRPEAWSAFIADVRAGEFDLL